MTALFTRPANPIRSRPLAGNYPAAVAIGLLALCPFIVLSTATQLLETPLTTQLATTTFGVELAAGLSNAAYAFGAVAAADLIQRFSARWVYVACEALFVAGSVLAAVSGNIQVFTAGRVLQGLATGMLLVAALPPLVTSHGARKLPLTAAFVNLGLFGMVTLGPLAGGLAASGSAWRWLFVVVGGLGAIGASLGLLGIDQAEGGDRRLGFDWSGIPLAAAATVLPFMGVAWIAKSGFASPGFIVPVLAGLVCLGVLLHRQYAKPDALMPLKLITHTLPLTGIGIAMVAGAAVTALIDLCAVYLTETLHEAPAVTGFLLATQVPGIALAAWLFKQLLTTRWLPALALGGLGAVTGGAALVLVVSPSHGLLIVGCAGFLLGAGAGSGVAPALFMAGLSAPSKKLGPTFALVELLRSEAAFLVAPVLLQLAMDASNLADGVRLAALVLLAFCVVLGAGLLGLLLLGGARPHAPDLERWMDGEEPAFDSPPLAALVRQDA